MLIPERAEPKDFLMVAHNDLSFNNDKLFRDIQEGDLKAFPFKNTLLQDDCYSNCSPFFLENSEGTLFNKSGHLNNS
mgnify:CR=1 FL=1